MKKKVRKYLLIFVVTFFVYQVAGYFLAYAQTGPGCMPDHLKGQLHTDYSIPAFQSVPRGTMYASLVQPPILLAGSSGYPTEAATNGEHGPKPIPGPGQWQLSTIQVKKGWPFYLFYVAYTTKNGSHFRLGTRWDDVDKFYVIWSAAWHRV